MLPAIVRAGIFDYEMPPEAQPLSGKTIWLESAVHALGSRKKSIQQPLPPFARKGKE